LTVVYPSTAFIDHPEPGFAEYAAAKEAGEALCRSLEGRDFRCLHPRLPRILTDQTNALIPLDTVDAIPVLLRLIRQSGEPRP